MTESLNRSCVHEVDGFFRRWVFRKLSFGFTINTGKNFEVSQFNPTLNYPLGSP